MEMRSTQTMVYRLARLLLFPSRSCLSQTAKGYQHAETAQSPSPGRSVGTFPYRGHRARPSTGSGGRAGDSRAQLHRQGGALLRIRIPRHLADFRETRGAAEPRLRAQERPVRRHFRVQHQVAEGYGRSERLLHRRQHRVGYLRRLQVRGGEGRDSRPSPTPTRSTSAPPTARRPSSTRTRSTTPSACRTARAPTTSSSR